MREIFRNRIEAGQLLAGKLMRYANQPNVIVLGLPRGGVPVAFEVAKALRAPLDVFVVRKLGTPGNREVAMGAIAAGGVRVLNEEVVVGLGIPIEVIDAVTAVVHGENLAALASVDNSHYGLREFIDRRIGMLPRVHQRRWIERTDHFLNLIQFQETRAGRDQQAQR